MNPISAPGATPSRCNGGVLNNNKKRNRNEFEAGGLYQSELPLHHRAFGHRPSTHGYINGAHPHAPLNPPPPAYGPLQPSIRSSLLQQQNSNFSLNPSPLAYKPPQPFSLAQQNSNNPLPCPSFLANIHSPRGPLLRVQDHQSRLNALPPNVLLNNSIGAVLDQQPHVQDNHPRALDNGNIADWDIPRDLKQLPEGQDLIHNIDEYYNFQHWELPHLPDGGVPQQQPRNDLLFDDVPDDNPPYDGLLDIARWFDWDSLDENESDEDLSQDGDGGLLEDNNFHGLQHSNGVPQQPIPAVIHNPNLKICDESGCIQPTFHQTIRARKCMFHLENPPPQSRCPNRVVDDA